MSLAELLSAAIKQSRYSRPQIADRMTDYLAARLTSAGWSPVTVSKMNDWTSESKERHRIPLEYLPAFCFAIENRHASRVLLSGILRPIGYQPISHNESIVFEQFKDETLKTIIDKRMKSRAREIAAKGALVFEELEP
jgi:hypothetical protein